MNKLKEMLNTDMEFINEYFLLVFVVVLLTVVGYTSYAIFTHTVSGESTIKVVYNPQTESEGILLTRAILGEDNINVVTTGDGLYSSTATTNGNPTYYYHGAIENNYVSFAGLTWRIVRITEDGIIKLILNSALDKNSSFNKNNNNYIYMYYSESNVTDGIMKNLEDWYDATLQENFDSYIAETNFCEAAKVKKASTYTSGNATMVVASASYKGDFTCKKDGNGKQYVTSKVGLLSIEEVIYAGMPIYYNGFSSSEYVKTTYLQVNAPMMWWLMSPGGYSNANANAGLVVVSGNVNINTVGSSLGVRPVISLNSNTIVTGTGAPDNMYEVVLNK